MSIIKGQQILSEIDTKSTIFFIQKYSLAVILKHGTTLGFPNAGPCNIMLLTIANNCSNYENAKFFAQLPCKSSNKKLLITNYFNYKVGKRYLKSCFYRLTEDIVSVIVTSKSAV